jgi:hypothetical protein
LPSQKYKTPNGARIKAGFYAPREINPAPCAVWRFVLYIMEKTFIILSKMFAEITKM